MSEHESRQRLTAASARLNAYADMLFDAREFSVSKRRHRLDLVTLSLDDLGLADGGSLPAVFGRAESPGFALCPLEVAPHPD